MLITYEGPSSAKLELPVFVGEQDFFADYAREALSVTEGENGLVVRWNASHSVTIPWGRIWTVERL